MKEKQLKIKADVIRWRQFSRHSDAIFRSLGREIRIGVLSVSTLLTAAPCSAVGKMAMSHQEGDVTEGILSNIITDDEPPLDTLMLEEGDLLFNVVVNQNDNVASAIVKVTEGINLQSISHVAIVCKQKGKLFALEATGKHGVWLNPIDSFIKNADHLTNGNPTILVGRLKDRSNIEASIQKALSYLGRPYDFLYMPDDKEIYCSELVQLSYINKEGKNIFPVIPMSFHDQTGKVTDFWKEYYKKRNMEVPEGWPGTNPGGISRSDAIEIVKKVEK